MGLVGLVSVKLSISSAIWKLNEALQALERESG